MKQAWIKIQGVWVKEQSLQEFADSQYAQYTSLNKSSGQGKDEVVRNSVIRAVKYDNFTI